MSNKPKSMVDQRSLNDSSQLLPKWSGGKATAIPVELDRQTLVYACDWLGKPPCVCSEQKTSTAHESYSSNSYNGNHDTDETLQFGDE